jgi:hypothetical protein
MLKYFACSRAEAWFDAAILALDPSALKAAEEHKR